MQVNEESYSACT